jgi:molecular chaperone GrpE
MSTDRKHHGQGPGAQRPGPAGQYPAPTRPQAHGQRHAAHAQPGAPGQQPGADEDERAAVAAAEPENELGPSERGTTTDADHDQVKDDLEALIAKAQKADEYLQLAQRTKADFENYRKRAIRDAAAAQDKGVAKLALELLPAVDNLDRALEAADATATTPATAAGVGAGGSAQAGEDGASSLISGIRLVHADVIAALARVGIEPFSPKGEPFDPQHHEAIAQQPIEGAQPGTVVEVYQRGYRLGETVLRPARVVVAA